MSWPKVICSFVRYNTKMTPCRDPENVGENWVLCDCPAHDNVARLLGIVSTSGKDFRPKQYPPIPARPRRNTGPK